MTQLSKPIIFETAFETYTATAILGEGGAGRVYYGTDSSGGSVAIKVLVAANANADKRRRFKNEVGFLKRLELHENIVPWLDDGLSKDSKIAGPFYVMPSYDGSLRSLIRDGIAAKDVLRLFGQLLAGLGAAHKRAAVHRDLKPENVLFRRKGTDVVLAIADFGIAQFHPDDQATLVETKAGARLANFDYHAPEQRQIGGATDARTDIFALGLMLNELFTGEVPRGVGFKRVADVAPAFAYVDRLIEAMMQRSPAARPSSIDGLLQKLNALHDEADIQQRIEALPTNVAQVEADVDPLIADPPKVVGARWEGGVLTLELSRPVNTTWISCLAYKMGSWESVWGAGPETFQFNGTKAMVRVNDSSAQNAIDIFKGWLPKATRAYETAIEAARQRAAEERRDNVRRERERLEQLQRVNSQLKF